MVWICVFNAGDSSGFHLRTKDAHAINGLRTSQFADNGGQQTDPWLSLLDFSLSSKLNRDPLLANTLLWVV